MLEILMCHHHAIFFSGGRNNVFEISVVSLFVLCANSSLPYIKYSRDIRLMIKIFFCLAA
jgi:hypothetical protein